MAFMPGQHPAAYEFGPFRLEVDERLLTKEGGPVPLAPKAFDVLSVLIQKGGRLISKEEIIGAVWPDSFVEESSLSQSIYTLRKALGEGEGGQSYVKTVPRHGYRFVAKVRVIEAEPADTETRDSPGTSAVVARAEDATRGDGGVSVALQTTRPPAPTWGAARDRARLILLALVVAAVAAATLLSVQLWRARGGGERVRSIAVLPFTPIGPDGGDVSHGLGMTDAVIMKLNSLQRFSVSPTSAVAKYGEGHFDPLTAGRELGVDAVLGGTLQRSGDTVRVTVQLVGVSDGSVIWTEKFDGHYAGIFSIQDDISERVAQQLKLRLTSQERRQLAKHYTESPEAYEAYARGLYFWNKRTQPALMRGIEYFESAARLDPNYALAYAGLADSYALLILLGDHPGLSREEAAERSRRAIGRALELDGELAEAHTALGMIRNVIDHDQTGAEHEFKRALSLNPNYATARQRYGVLLLNQGKPKEAADQFAVSYRLEPVSPSVINNLCYVHYIMRDYDRSAEYCRKTLELEPRMGPTLLTSGHIRLQTGSPEGAVELYRRALEASEGWGPVKVRSLEALGVAHAAWGDVAGARQMIAELNRFTDPGTLEDAQFSVALIRSALGEMDRSFLILQRQARSWDSTPPMLMLDPRFDRLRADPRYAGLQRPPDGGESPLGRTRPSPQGPSSRPAPGTKPPPLSPPPTPHLQFP